SERKNEFEVLLVRGVQNIQKVSYPSIRSWITSIVISPYQELSSTMQTQQKLTFELVNRILVGEFVALHRNVWKAIMNEFDRLYGAINKVHDDFLGCFHTIKHVITVNSNYLILSNPNLSKKQVQKLFEKFKLEHKFKVCPDVIEDIYLQTNGYV
ncbi:9381_t:CDS:2, partial [Funneliformis caledonium]